MIYKVSQLKQINFLFYLSTTSPAHTHTHKHTLVWSQWKSNTEHGWIQSEREGHKPKQKRNYDGRLWLISIIKLISIGKQLFRLLLCVCVSCKLFWYYLLQVCTAKRFFERSSLDILRVCLCDLGNSLFLKTLCRFVLLYVVGSSFWNEDYFGEFYFITLWNCSTEWFGNFVK